jgi:hypothetical protein
VRKRIDLWTIFGIVLAVETLLFLALAGVILGTLGIGVRFTGWSK